MQGEARQKAYRDMAFHLTHCVYAPVHAWEGCVGTGNTVRCPKRYRARCCVENVHLVRHSVRQCSTKHANWYIYGRRVFGLEIQTKSMVPCGRE